MSRIMLGGDGGSGGRFRTAAKLGLGWSVDEKFGPG